MARGNNLLEMLHDMAHECQRCLTRTWEKPKGLTTEGRPRAVTNVSAVRSSAKDEI